MNDLPAPNEVMARIQKLLNLAAKNPSQEEAALAMEKANELMLKWNLSTAAVERSSGVIDGKREELKVQGGFYQYQRSLWESLAELHFCLYWTQEYNAVRDKTIKRRGAVYAKGSSVVRKRHRLVGRIINTTAVRHMAEYLEGSIERALRERLTIVEGDTTRLDHGNLWSAFGISFREGAVDELMIKISARRHQMLRDEGQRKERQQEQADAGVSNSTALTLSTYIDAETDANNDFLYGEGWSAEQARERAERAAEYERRSREYTEWAAAHPEEAQKREEEARKSRRRQRHSYGRAEREREKDWRAYGAGRDTGKSISLDPQAGSQAGKARRLK